MVRDAEHETHLVKVAALSLGLATTDAEGQTHLSPSAKHLDDYALSRALPGGVRTDDRDLIDEVRQELCDARNYLCWHIQQNLDAALEGETDGARSYESSMRALAGVLQAYEALATVADD